MMCCQVFVLGMLLVGSLAASVPSSSKDETISQGSDAAESDQRAFTVNQLPPLTYSSKKYKVYMDVVNFFQAWQMCISKGERLASVENEADHKAMREAILPYSGYAVVFWIAGTNVGAKRAEQDKFYWITNDRPVGYLNGFEKWLLGVAPSDPNQCVALYLPSAMWISGPCDSSGYYVCEESQDV
uniref:Uncharacterized protein n=1 Tax=Anopheles atroparvus TaxID=41427 RepID=A0A182J0N5_ANOAO